MRRLNTFLLLLFTTLVIQAQSENERYSVNLMQWLYNEANYPEKNSTSLIYKSKNTEYMSAFIKVNNSLNEEALKKLGVITGTKAGNIWTVRIPKESMVTFTQLGGIEYIELDRPLRQQMDSARLITGVDSVIKGIGLEFPLTGKGVIIGISDNGFDYTHPTFYDTTYSYLRIKRVWNQILPGTPPAGYSYGTELSDTASILNRKYDFIKFGSHGNMVSSVAAGSGIGSKNNSLHRGVAYESDMVLTTTPNTYLDWRASNMTTIVDGFNYIFEYAVSEGKPAVINASLGSNLGPRDGTSLFSQACDNLSGPGKILVFSAMNLGGSKTHLGKSFTPGDTVVHTLIPNLVVDNGQFKNYIEIWGDSFNTFCLQFSLYKNGLTGNSSSVYCLDNSVKEIRLIGSDNDTCFITLTTKKLEHNNRPHAAFEIFTKTKDTLLLSAFATSGKVHMWQEYFDTSWIGYYGGFVGNGTTIQGGDDNYTIGEMGCTKSAITVGASISKKYWKNINNASIQNPSYSQQGAIAPYSSKGPDLNEQMKPDITAPGGMIATAVSSYDTDYLPGGAFYSGFTISKYISTLNNRTYYYGIVNGTSFASPFTAGVIALMLQADPNLTPARTKEILYKTAVKDSFTTYNPNPAIWGAGKINAYAAIKETIRTRGNLPIPSDELDIKLYPNPASEKFTLEYESAGTGIFLVEINNPLGQLIQTKLWPVIKGKNQFPVQLDTNVKGIYYVDIIGNGSTITKKVVIR